MSRKREDCVYFRIEDGCKWCDLGYTCSSNLIGSCSKFQKRLTASEYERVSDLNQVWDYLFKHEQCELCDVVSKEIGIIKGVFNEEEL